MEKIIAELFFASSYQYVSGFQAFAVVGTLLNKISEQQIIKFLVFVFQFRLKLIGVGKNVGS